MGATYRAYVSNQNSAFLALTGVAPVACVGVSVILGLRKPHIELRNGVWFYTVYRRSELTKRLFKFIQCGDSVQAVWDNFLVWPGL